MAVVVGLGAELELVGNQGLSLGKNGGTDGRVGKHGRIVVRASGFHRIIHQAHARFPFVLSRESPSHTRDTALCLPASRSRISGTGLSSH